MKEDEKENSATFELYKRGMEKAYYPPSVRDKGLEALEELLEIAENMTVEEYKEIYNRVCGKEGVSSLESLSIGYCFNSACTFVYGTDDELIYFKFGERKVFPHKVHLQVISSVSGDIKKIEIPKDTPITLMNSLDKFDCSVWLLELKK